mgnify:CR=1 FL=1
MTVLLILIIASSIILSIALPYFVKKKTAQKNDSHSIDGETKIDPKVDSASESNNSGDLIKKGKPKRRPLVSVILVLSIIVVPIFIAFNGCESDYSTVTFALVKNGKNYIYSPNEYLVNKAITQNEVPTGLNSNVIYFIDDQVYLSPDNLERVINILSGNFKTIDHKELSYDGYAVNDSLEVYNSKVQNKAGEKIGEVEAINVVTISSKTNNNQTMTIKWKTLPELIAIENCSIESIWEVTHPYPGKTVGNWEDAILVNLNTINSFYGNSFELDFDEESSVLYFKMLNNN